MSCADGACRAKFFHDVTATLPDPRVKNNNQAALPHAARMKLFKDRLPKHPGRLEER